ncbi:hypothetical protein [Luethyella okanaganae]|uniref:Integral membrane protein n=1 Tax=Luethyella okanaganae TaxID=69372 RepID=A0ABW1VEB8_9MICO
MKRPASTVIGAVLMFGRVVSGLVYIAVAASNWRAFSKNLVLDGAAVGFDTEHMADVVLIVFMVAYASWLMFYLVLTVLVFRGSNWARIVAMSLASLSIVIAFIDWWNSGVEVSLRTSLLSLSLDILILLALSSHSTRLFARRDGRAVALDSE